jgi:hypothetical protein
VSLRDRTPKVAPAGRRARIEEIRDELETADRAVLDEWLRDLRFAPERIAAELREEGHPISASSIARYRYEVLKVGKRKR